MQVEQAVPGWQAVSRAVEQELVGWRQAHPRATLAELEDVVSAAVSRLQARYLEDLAHASAARDLTAVAPEERPQCPACGEVLVARGRQERRVVTPRQRETLRLQRDYGVCPACHAGSFPP